MSLLTSPPTLAIVAVGSNLGRPREVVMAAIAAVKVCTDERLLRSSLHETAPVDCPPGSPNFVNAVVAFVPRPDETPESLLAKLQEIEQEFGRQPKQVLNEPRPLDLDLIAFGNEVRPAAPQPSKGGNTQPLVLPHPRAHLRKFVLQPLAEIAPDLVLPGQTKTVAELLARL